MDPAAPAALWLNDFIIRPRRPPQYGSADDAAEETRRAKSVVARKRAQLTLPPVVYVIESRKMALRILRSGWLLQQNCAVPIISRTERVRASTLCRLFFGEISSECKFSLVYLGLNERHSCCWKFNLQN